MFSVNPRYQRRMLDGALRGFLNFLLISARDAICVSQNQCPSRASPAPIDKESPDSKKALSDDVIA
jgi:hypothetical protein